MKKLFLSLFFAGLIFLPKQSSSMDLECEECVSSIKGALTLGGTFIVGTLKTQNLEKKKANFKKKETETYKALGTLTTITSIKTLDLQDQLITQLPEKDKQAFERCGSSIERRLLMCRSRINYYQARHIAYASAQDLMKKQQTHNRRCNYLYSLIGFLAMASR